MTMLAPALRGSNVTDAATPAAVHQPGHGHLSAPSMHRLIERETYLHVKIGTTFYSRRRSFLYPSQATPAHYDGDV